MDNNNTLNHSTGNNHKGNNNNNDDRKKRNKKTDGPKREAILNLEKYQDKEIIVDFIGGRQVTGVLKGFDQLMNLVLDDVKERLRDEENDVLLEETRDLGLVIIRGPQLVTLAPVDGSGSIENPFVSQLQ